MLKILREMLKEMIHWYEMDRVTKRVFAVIWSIAIFSFIGLGAKAVFDIKLTVFQEDCLFLFAVLVTMLAVSTLIFSRPQKVNPEREKYFRYHK